MRKNAWTWLPKLNGLWKKGAGTPEDPNNGRLFWRILGIHPDSWRRYPGPAVRTIAGYFRLAWNELTRYETEVCQRCGRKVRQIWWCGEQELWCAVTGYGSPTDKDAGGVLCIRCFDELYQKLGRGFLRWHPERSR